MKQQIFCTKKHLMVILGLPLGRMGGRADGFFRFYEFFFFQKNSKLCFFCFDGLIWLNFIQQMDCIYF